MGIHYFSCVALHIYVKKILACEPGEMLASK